MENNPIQSIGSGNQGEKWLSMSEAALGTPYSAEYLSLLARKGKLSAKKIDNTWFTNRQVVDDYMKRQMIRTQVQNGNMSPVQAQPVVNAQTPISISSGVTAPVSSSRLKAIRSYRDDHNEYQARIVKETPHVAIEQALEKVIDKKFSPSSHFKPSTMHRTTAPRLREWTAGLPKSFVKTAIIATISLTILPVPFVFGFVEKGLDAAMAALNDARTVMGFRPGTHENELLLLDKEGNISIMGHVETDGQLRSHVANGVAPIVVDSTTQVANLNADLLDNMQAAEFTLAFVTKNGAMTTEDVQLYGNVEVGKTLLVKGASKLLSSLEVQGDLKVFGEAEFKQAMRVLGPAQFEGVVEMMNNLSVKKNINVRGSVTSGSSVIGKKAGFEEGSIGDLVSNVFEAVTGTIDDLVSRSIVVDGLTAATSSTITASTTNFTSASSTITRINFDFATGTSATTTNFYSASIVGGEATTTNFYSSLGTIGTLNVTGNAAVTGNFTVSGDTTTIGQLLSTRVPTLPHVFSVWPAGTSNASDATIYINPATAGADTNIFAAAVGGTVKFLVDAEGDLYANNLVLSGSTSQGETTVAGNLTVQDSSTLGDAPSDLTTLSSQLLALASTTLQNFTFVNATGTSATTTNFFATTASSTNLFATALRAGDSTLGGINTSGITTTGNILASTGSINIGSSGTRFGTIYADTVDATSLTGTVVSGSTSANDWLINSDNATADTENMTLGFERGSLTPNALLTWNATSDRFEFNSDLYVGSGIGNGSLLVNGSTTLQNFTAQNSTTTSATTTNLYAGSIMAGNILPSADNTYDLGSSALRWKTLHVGPGSVVVHNDATNTLKATLGFSGSTAQLVTDAATPLQITTGANTGLNVDTSGRLGVGVSSPGYALEVSGAASTTNLYTANGNVSIYNQAGVSEGGEIKVRANNGTDYYLQNFGGVFRGINNGRTTAIWQFDQSGNLSLGASGTATLTSGAINGQTISSAASFTGTLSTVGSIFSGDEFRFTSESRIISTGDGAISLTNNAGNANATLAVGTINGQTISSTANFTGTITTGGNINIGGSTYYVSGSGGSNLYALTLNRSGGTGYTSPDIFGGTGGLVIGGLVSGGGTIALNTSGGSTPTMYLNSSGNVGINTTSPVTKLSVVGEGEVGDGPFIVAGGGSSSSYYDQSVGAYNHTPGFMVRNDNAYTDAGQMDATMVLYNRNGTDNTGTKLVFANNETSGSANPVATAAIASQKVSGTAGAWATGNLKFLVKNGASYVDALTINSSGNTTLAGTLTVGSTITEAGSAVLSAADVDTCAEVAALTVETGSCGSVVLSTSPSLTTPNIGAATGSSLNLSGSLQIDIAGGGQVWLGRTHGEGGEIKLTSTAGGTGGWIQGYASGLRFVDYGWTTTTFAVDNSGNTTVVGNLTVQGTGNSTIAGNVGLGVTPSYKLDLADNSALNIRGTSGQLYVNNIAPNTGSTVSFASNTVTAGSFSGAGTGLTGTASSLNIGGNAGTATTLQTARTINGVSFNGSANIAVPSLYDTNYRRITNPGGAEYVTTAASVTGAIAITMPVWTPGMYKMTIEVYEYTTNESFTLVVGGHNSDVTWYNEFAYITANQSVDRRFNVRFGRTAGGLPVIYIGELGSTWSYPQVYVTDFQHGYTGNSVSFATGWSIGFETSAFAGVTRTQSLTQIGYAVSTNTANASVLRDGSGNFSAGTASLTGLTVANGDSSYATFGPNGSWGAYLRVGSGPTQSTTGIASITSTDGNLHLDPAASKNIYIGYYQPRDVFINAQGGNVSIGKASASGLLDLESTGASVGYWLDGQAALTGYTGDQWLRLNQNSSFTNGVYTPGNFRSDGGYYGGGTVNIRETLGLNGNRVDAGTTYMNVRGTHASATGIQLESSQGTLQGWLYADTTGQGFLTDAGGWKLMVPSTAGASIMRENTYTMWDSGNDGSGSGLDADILDGLTSSQFVRTDTTSTISTGNVLEVTNGSAETLNGLSGNRGVTLYQGGGAGTDAFMTFHVGGDYAGYFGLGGAENDLIWGGWSVGNNRHRVLHSGNSPYAWNMNQYVRTSDSPTFANVYVNGGGATDRMANVNTSGWGVDALNNGSWDLLVYNGGQIYFSDAYVGYGGTAYLRTYDTNENLTIDPNGSGIVDVVGTVDADAYTIGGTQFMAAGARLYADTLNARASDAPLEFGYDQAGDFQLFGGDLTGVNNHYIYPARTDTAAVQKLYYLASHGSWGLYSNTGMNAVGGLYDNGNRAYSAANVPGVSVFSNDAGYVTGTGVGANGPCDFVDINADGLVTTCYGSDQRLKTNINDLDSSGTVLDRIQQISGKTYEYNSLFYERNPSALVSGEQIGFIAQEVQRVFPQVITTDQDGYLGIVYSQMVPIVWEGLKEVYAKVISIEERLTALEYNASSTPATVSTSTPGFVASVLETIVATVENGVTKFTALIVDNLSTYALTVGKAEQPAGITIYDEDTGAPFCIKVKSGQQIAVSGECGAQLAQQPSSGGTTFTPVEITGPTASSTEPTASSTEPTTQPTASSTPTTTEPLTATSTEPVVEPAPVADSTASSTDTNV